MAPSSESARPLPAQRAFVIQFSAQTDVVRGQFSGRVEHVVTGHARRFQTLDELVACMMQMLVTLGTTPLKGGADADCNPDAPQR